LQLYDLTKDPHEENNVAEDFPEVVAELESLMQVANKPSPIDKFNFSPPVGE
jgi:hypothetical protein